MRTRSGEGWGQLPREIARALAGEKFNGYEGKVVWAIVYKTIAFTKEEDKIPQSQLVKLTGIHQRHLYRAVNSLLKKGVIFKRGNVYGIQRDFSKWENTPNQVYTKKIPLIRAEIPLIREENTPNQVDSRDLSKRAIQERGLSASKDKKRGKKQWEIIHKAKKEFERILKEKKEI